MRISDWSSDVCSSDLDAARGRTVAARIGEQHRRLEAGDEPLVAVRRRVGEGVQRLGVLDHAADEIEAHVRQAGIAVAGEQRLADRKSVVEGKSVSLRVVLGGRRIIKKKNLNRIVLYTAV